jgi:hypothetical protein
MSQDDPLVERMTFYVAVEFKLKATISYSTLSGFAD